MKDGIGWIPREMVQSPYCIGLCIDEDQFKRAIKRLNVSPAQQPLKWILDGCDGKVHVFEEEEDFHRCIIVCARYDPKRNPNEVVGLIVHEAVHVWQRICDCIGEYEPSLEFEAYSIQAITQRLIALYSEMMAVKKKPKIVKKKV
jgi:hypothetical protein